MLYFHLQVKNLHELSNIVGAVYKMCNILNPKPKIPLVYSPLSWRPSRNYIRHVLYSDIQQFQPKCSLDAACGQLMHYWMFETGEYWGIDIGYLTILFGLGSKINRKLINERGTERLRLINGDLLRHIGELGPFGLVVSTYTLNLISKVKFVSSRRVNDPNNFRQR